MRIAVDILRSKLVCLRRAGLVGKMKLGVVQAAVRTRPPVSRCRRMIAKVSAGAPFANDTAPRVFVYLVKSTKCDRDCPGSNGSLKYWVSRATFPSLNSMMLTV